MSIFTLFSKKKKKNPNLLGLSVGPRFAYTTFKRGPHAAAYSNSTTPGFRLKSSARSYPTIKMWPYCRSSPAASRRCTAILRTLWSPGPVWSSRRRSTRESSKHCLRFPVGRWTRRWLRQCTCRWSKRRRSRVPIRSWSPTDTVYPEPCKLYHNVSPTSGLNIITQKSMAS